MISEAVLVNWAVNIFIDNTMSHFKKILQQRQKQQTLQRFFVKKKRKATADKEDLTKLKRQIREKNRRTITQLFYREKLPFKAITIPSLYIHPHTPSHHNQNVM